MRCSLHEWGKDERASEGVVGAPTPSDGRTAAMVVFLRGFLAGFRGWNGGPSQARCQHRERYSQGSAKGRCGMRKNAIKFGGAIGTVQRSDSQPPEKL